MTKHFIAIDLGATSGRVMLASLGEEGIDLRTLLRFPTPLVEDKGAFYWDIDQIFSSILEGLSLAGKEGVKVTSIGIDTWGVDFGCIGADGALTGRPRSYRDPYTRGIPEQVFAKIPREALYARTGIQIMDFNTIFQLYARTRSAEADLSAAEHILFMPDLVSYLLTGHAVCEYTDASTSGMMDQARGQFDKALLEELGIRSDILLPIVPSGTMVGPLKPELAEQTGLGPVPVIAVAGHDTASAVAAVPAEDEHFAYLSSGTWSLMGIEVPAPIMNEDSARENFTNEGGIEGTTRFLKNITGMWLLEQCRAVWKKEGKDYSYAELQEMALREKDFPGRINPDDPRFAAPGDMVAEITAALSASPVTPPVIPSECERISPAQIVSCIYHSLADRYAEVLGILCRFAPFPIERLHIIGGGSANGLLNQWTADACGIPVVAGPTEATAIGNVMLQAKSAGLVADRWEMRRLIACAFPITVIHAPVPEN
ncbi:MAG: rhamnulokinase [Bacteroidales bacterium]|nr:rhamnulokinase [Bacteroidales bacterium]